MATTKLKSTNCGDWHRSWGFSTNRLGKLHQTDQPNVYFWKGWCQGRHGQVWNKGQKVKVLHDPETDNLEVEALTDSSRLPDRRDVIEAIRTLNAM